MAFAAITTLPSSELLVFLGLLTQAAAVFWLWRDWQLSQYQHADWRRDHGRTETETLRVLNEKWLKFAGGNSPAMDWDNISAAELEELGKIFPASDDTEPQKNRKVDLITRRFGVGPSDNDLTTIRAQLDHLALLQRGVADYRTFVRRKTFGTALKLILIGFGLQLVGSIPSRIIVQIETPDQPSAGAPQKTPQ